MVPVFIFGSLRSGTTLLRLIINSHPDLSNPGEADFLFDGLDLNCSPPCYNKNQLQRDWIFSAQQLSLRPDLDGIELLHDMLAQLSEDFPGRTSVNIHRHSDKLAKTLPEAKVVHLVRDPRDVARSSIGMGWAGTTYHGVDHWIETERTWTDAAQKFHENHVLNLRYESLLKNPKNELLKLCKFLEVEWNAEMLEFHNNSSYSPIDAKLAYQWRSTASPNEVRYVEAKAGALMKQRGYHLTQDRAKPIRNVEKIILSFKNRISIWNFGVKRYGFRLYILEKITRYFRLTHWNSALHDKIQIINSKAAK
ncbi:MAG: sulfotransferase [Pseudomonadota bacterium]